MNTHLGIDEEEGISVRRRGRPCKRQNIPEKKLFDEQSSSDNEDSISAYEQDEGRRQEDDDEDAPFIHSIRSFNLGRKAKFSGEL